jgi:hypothetical protein
MRCDQQVEYDLLSISMARWRMLSESLYPVAMYSAATGKVISIYYTAKGQQVELTARSGFICLINGRALVASFLILVFNVRRHAEVRAIQSATIELSIEDEFKYTTEW